MKSKSIVSLVLAILIIASSIMSALLVAATPATNPFATQHMEVDFSKYVVNNTKNSGNTRFGVANDGISITIDEDNDKYLHFSVSDQYLKRYYYCDRSVIINPIGGTSADTAYFIDEGARYRVTFDYQVSKAVGTNDVYVMVYSNTSYAITSSSVNKTTPQLAKIKLDSATSSAKKSGWYTATAEFTGPTATAKSSLAFAFLNSIQDYEGNGATVSDSESFPYDIKVDNVVVDRLGTAILNYSDGTEKILYGVPASTNENMRRKSDETTPNTDVYSIVSAEKINLPQTEEWYSDANFTDKVDTADFIAGEMYYYAVDKSFKTQHMEVDFSKYVVNNTKNSGNTRFGVANDGINITIDEDTDKYLHFSVSDQYLKRYYYCDRSVIINPIGGTSADTAYFIDEGARYRVTFDYQVSKAVGTNDVYVMVYSNTSYAITSSSVNKTTPQLAKIKLDSTTTSAKRSGWYTATAEFVGPAATAKSSLAFAFLNSIQDYEGNGATIGDSGSFPYDIKVDNVVVDRLGTVTLNYSNGETETLYGIPASTNENMRRKSDGVTPNTDVYSTVSAEKINLPQTEEWYSDANFTDKVNPTDFLPTEVEYYANTINSFPGEFKTQHMEVDFSEYSILNGNGNKGTTSVPETTKDQGNTRFGLANDGVSFSIDGDSDKYLHFAVSDKNLKRYFYCDRACIINRVGGTNVDNSYFIEEAANYRITFDYQVEKADGTGDVYVLVYSNTSYAITSSSVKATTPELAKIKLDSANVSSSKDGWYTATADFVGPAATAKSSLAFAFLTSMTTEASGATINNSTNFPYDIKIDNVVADRLGSVALHYTGGSSEKIYGVPEATVSNMRCKSDDVTPNTDVYSITNSQQVDFPKDATWYSDSDFIDKVDSAVFMPYELDYYAQTSKVVDVNFKTQHMEVTFDDYSVLNGNGKTGKTTAVEIEKNKGNTRFGIEDDGVSFSIEGDSDKYLQFAVSDQYLNRYYYSDRAFIVNPTGGTTADTSYVLVEAANYRVSFDYQVSKADGTGDVYALVYSNSAYAITNSTINSSVEVFAKIKLDSAVKSSNREGWYTATVDFIGAAAAKSSLAFAFVTSRTEEAKDAISGSNSNFPYGVRVDNIIADRLASAKIYYADGTKSKAVGAPVSTKENMYSNTEKLYSEYSGELIGVEGNWFYDSALAFPADSDMHFLPVENKHYYQEGYAKNATTINPSDGFHGGDGTKDNPYLISNANELAYLAQLVKRSSGNKLTKGNYYKLTNDIVINKNVDSPEYSWITGTKSTQTFDGTLDGDGHTISGLYIEETNVLGGLFISLGSGATIKKLGIINSYVETTEKAGAFAATVDTNNTDEVQIIACYCDESVVVDGNSGYVGGFIGYADSPVMLRYCYFTGTVESSLLSRAGVSLGFSNSKLIINSSYFAPEMVLDSAINRVCGTVGTGSAAYNTYATNNTGIAYVRQFVKEDMFSNKALENMTRLDFENIWTVTDKTPELRIFTDASAIEPEEFSDPFDFKVYDGAKPGDVWSGGYSSGLKGSGTENDPYLISTAEDMAYLAKIVSEFRVINKENLTYDKYYRLTDDIYLNDVSDKNWLKNNPRQWIFGWSRDQAFCGHLDGAGHVVYGMYFDEICENIYCSLLIAVDPGAEIKNLGIANSSIYNYSGYSSGIVCGIKQLNVNPANKLGLGNGITSISNCFIASDVILESTSGTVGGILAGAGHAFTIKDCYSLATVTGGKNLAGMVFGHSWDYKYTDSSGKLLPSTIVNCFGINSSKNRASGSVTDAVSADNFYSNSSTIDLSVFIPQSKMVGDSAKTALVGFDFDNTWQVMPNLSAGLRVFSNVVHKDTSSFYCTKPITTITFDSCNGAPVASISGYPGDRLVLPTATRNADIFDGWYVYPTYDVPFNYNYLPEDDITLYAKYKVVGSDQNFEDYEYSTPGADGMDDDYELFGIGSRDFSSDYLHSGIHSLHRIGAEDNYQVASLANPNTKKLVVGNEYTLKMCAYLKESSALDEQLILAFLKYPDWAYEVIDTQNICKISTLSVGKWKEITLKFVAAGEYLGIVTPGNTNIFFDDITVTPTGKTGLTNTSLNGPYVEPGIEYITREVPDESVYEDAIDVSSVKKRYKVIKRIKKKNLNTEDYTWIYLIAGAGVLILGGATTFVVVLVKRKKRRASH